MRVNIILILLILGFSNLSLQAQNSRKYALFAGYGYYEASFLGLMTRNESTKNNWKLGAGYNFHFDNMLYYTLFAEYQKSILRFADENIAAGISLKSIYWVQSDEFMVWRNLGLNPGVYGEAYLGNNLSVSISGGPQFNLHLTNERKSYEATAWVKRIDINFQIALIYALPY